MNRRILIITVLVALVVILNNWLSDQREDTAQERAAEQRHIADYFLRDFITTTMDDRGLPEQRLAAEQMLRYADDHSMELMQPRLTLYVTDEAPWQIDAAHGHVSGDGTQIQLGGGVRVTRNENGEQLELVTDDLLLQPRERYAETDAPLTLNHSQGRVDAVGLRAYMKDERLELLAQVRGNHAASH